MWLLGIDTGGTFTDFVLYNGRSLKIHKRLSTPEQPEQAIIQGIQELGVPLTKLDITHGSTVATNAALENKGVKTAYITNFGLADTLTIGRQARQSLYSLQPKTKKPPVPADLCLETGGRLSADKECIEPLDDDDLQSLKNQIERLQPQAVAINLLFSFLDDTFEKQIEEIMPEGVFVSRSSFIHPQYKEYERGITTWLNASVGPLVERYINRLAENLPHSKLSIMQSTGGTIAAEYAGKYAVQMLLSGPAGGLAGASFVAASCNKKQLLTFDMGGTSTDVSLIDGDPKLTHDTIINHYPVAIPMVDIHTIGAGGGSIAWIDEGGMLQVGPQSAGASPGPACYDQGGTLPTVTDANLVLGKLRSQAFLGGGMTLKLDNARQAIQPIAETLNLSIEETAQGIIQIANEHMAQALRVISIQRGLDPRQFTLVSFGGAGGLHVCALADALDMQDAIVPVHAGVLSALGMLAASKRRQLSKTVSGLLSNLSAASIEEQFVILVKQGASALQDENVAADSIEVSRSIDVRYVGQSYTLNIPWHNVSTIQEDFAQAHQARYGHQLPLDIELVNIRVSVNGPAPELHLETMPTTSQAIETYSTKIYGIDEKTNIIARNNLQRDKAYPGPLIITETISTTFVAPHWECNKDQFGNLLLSKT